MNTTVSDDSVAVELERETSFFYLSLVPAKQDELHYCDIYIYIPCKVINVGCDNHWQLQLLCTTNALWMNVHN